MSDVPSSPVYIPKTIGQVLHRTFRLIRANLALFLGIASVPPAALMVSLGVIFGGILIPGLAHLQKNSTPAQNEQFEYFVVPAAIFVLLLYGIIFAPACAASAEAAVQADLGKPITFREAYAHAFHRFGRHVLLLILISLLSMGPVVLLEMGGLLAGRFFAHGKTSVSASAMFALIPGSILLFLGCFVVSVIVMLRLSLAYPASVTEDLSAVSALKRSKRLTKDARGRIFVVLLVVYAVTYIGYALVMYTTFLVFMVGALIGAGLHMQLPHALSVLLLCILMVAYSAVFVFFMAATWAGYSTALAVIYNDQRMRVDGMPSTIAPSGAAA